MLKIERGSIFLPENKELLLSFRASVEESKTETGGHGDRGTGPLSHFCNDYKIKTKNHRFFTEVHP